MNVDILNNIFYVYNNNILCVYYNNHLDYYHSLSIIYKSFILIFFCDTNVIMSQFYAKNISIIFSFYIVIIILIDITRYLKYINHLY